VWRRVLMRDITDVIQKKIVAIKMNWRKGKLIVWRSASRLLKLFLIRILGKRK
jgi:hypothetical protein